MSKKTYLPTKEADRVLWLNNFAGKIAGYSSTFGISNNERDAIIAMALIYAYIIGLIDKSKAFTKALTKFKGILSIAPTGTALGAIPVNAVGVAPPLTQAGIFTFISGIVQRIKGNLANYNETIGDEATIYLANLIKKRE